MSSLLIFASKLHLSFLWRCEIKGQNKTCSRLTVNWFDRILIWLGDFKFNFKKKQYQYWKKKKLMKNWILGIPVPRDAKPNPNFFHYSTYIDFFLNLCKLVLETRAGKIIRKIYIPTCQGHMPSACQSVSPLHCKWCWSTLDFSALNRKLALDSDAFCQIRFKLINDGTKKKVGFLNLGKSCFL